MSNHQAFWIHGTSVQMEREGYFISKRRAGYAAVFKTYGSEWFHFAVPTPVVLEGSYAKLTKVFVFFKTQGTAKITNVHVYSAGTKIYYQDNLSLSGDHSGQVDSSNSWAITSTPVAGLGIGISVCVDFGSVSTGSVPEIWFTTAGADFETS